MFLTAQAISDSLNYVKDDINIDFCTGQYTELIDTTHNIPNNDVIIVWEHKEIVDMINYIGIDLDKWPDEANEEYNVVFMINIHQPTLYYECYNWENRDKTCSPSIDKWLKKYDRISEYHENYGAIIEHRYMLTTTPKLLTNVYNYYIGLFIIVFTATVFVIILGLFIIVFKKLIEFIRMKHENVRRYKYVSINDETRIINNIPHKHKYTQT
jgi:ABC-type antimicrobial peptide transport system permease subunit